MPRTTTVNHQDTVELLNDRSEERRWSLKEALDKRGCDGGIENKSRCTTIKGGYMVEGGFWCEEKGESRLGNYLIFKSIFDSIKIVNLF